MAKLGGLIKRAGLKEKNTPLSVRVPTSLLEAFSAHCGSLGISVSDGVRLLMENEIKEDLPPVPTFNEKALQGPPAPAELRDAFSAVPVAGARFEDSKLISVNATPAALAAASANKSPRGSAAAFAAVVNGEKMLPCPVCGVWSNYSNFKRDHAAKHGFNSTADFFKEYKEKAQQMKEEAGL